MVSKNYYAMDGETQMNQDCQQLKCKERATQKCVWPNKTPIYLCDNHKNKLFEIERAFGHAVDMGFNFNIEGYGMEFKGKTMDRWKG